MEIYTIGFTRKSAKSFFSLIKSAKVKTLIDVRLNNKSQLAGFAKQDDLKYFLKELCKTDYVHLPDLTPTPDLLSAYRKGDMTWDLYAKHFVDLISHRKIENSIQPELLNNGCLMCSEHEPHFCHRRLVAEYLQNFSRFNLTITHLY